MKVVHVKKRRPTLPWATSEILEAIVLKEQLWRKSRRSPNNAALKLDCKIHRKRVNTLIRSAKRSYFTKKISDAGSDVKKTWSMINEFRGCLKTNVADSLIKHFGTDLTLTVKKFNPFFAGAGVVASHCAGDRFPAASSISESAFLPSLTEPDLRSYPFGFKRFRSAGVDGIAVGDLCRNYDSLKDVLLVLINNILDSGIVYSDLKQALVVPLFKGGVPNEISSYRPISIMPCILQILAKHLVVVMSSFLEKHAIISPNQYGFVAGRGTTDLLETFSDFLHSSFEHNMHVCALFIDVTKAFDTVDHDILLGKLYRLGFRGPFHALLKCFLTNRTQVVAVGNVRSAKALLRSGVPQGSILSPRLFNVFVKDISSSITNSIMFQYADDTVLLSRYLVYQRAVEMLQLDVISVMDWFSVNKLRVNASKTKLICFCNPLKNIRLTYPLFLHNSGCLYTQCDPIEYVSSIKYLGIYFDGDLSWTTHMTHLYQRLRSVFCMLYNIKRFLPFLLEKGLCTLWPTVY